MARKRKKKIKRKKRLKRSRRALLARRVAETLAESQQEVERARLRGSTSQSDTEVTDSAPDTTGILDTETEPTWTEVVEMAAENAPEPVTEEGADIGQPAEAWEGVPGVVPADLTEQEGVEAASPEMADGPAVAQTAGKNTTTGQAAIQRALKGTDTTEDEVPGRVLDVIGKGGKPLEADQRQYFEQRMGADFSDVRIHTGSAAAEAADAIDAKAFTCGNDIVFNAGEFDPESPKGQFLLAHELAHVRQQNSGAPLSMLPREEGEIQVDPDATLEREADQTAQEAVAGDQPPTTTQLGTDVHIQRVHSEATRYLKGEAEKAGSDGEKTQRTLDGATLGILEKYLDEDELQILLESHLDDETIKQLVSDVEVINAVSQESDGTIVMNVIADSSGEGAAVKGVVVFPQDAPAVFDAANQKSDTPGAGEKILDDSGNLVDAWEQLPNKSSKDADHSKGEFNEKKITPHVLEQRFGIEMLGVDTACGAGENGIDGIAWDPDNETLLIVEAKWTSEDKSAGTGPLGEPNAGLQGTHDWVSYAWDRGIDEDNIHISEYTGKYEEEIINHVREKAKQLGLGEADREEMIGTVQDAVEVLIRFEDYETAYFFTSDSESYKSVSTARKRSGQAEGKRITDIFDRVYHFKAGGMTDGGS